jgi:hypothetical protein
MVIELYTRLSFVRSAMEFVLLALIDVLPQCFDRRDDDFVLLSESLD